MSVSVAADFVDPGGGIPFFSVCSENLWAIVAISHIVKLDASISRLNSFTASMPRHTAHTGMVPSLSGARAAEITVRNTGSVLLKPTWPGVAFLQLPPDRIACQDRA